MMKNLKIYLIRMFTVMALFISIASCDVHEFPEIPLQLKPLVVQLNLDFDTEMPLYKTIVYDTKANEASSFDIRYTINMYKGNAVGDFSREADSVLIITKSSEELLNHSINLELNEGLYKFIIWTDFVERGQAKDYIYSTDNFEKISYVNKDNYMGSNDFKDAFYGVSTLELNNELFSFDSIHKVTVPMNRPLGKFKIVATDFTEFLSNQNQDNDFKLTDYKVRFYYPEYLPSTFNIFTDKPVDSWRGIAFESSMTELENKEIELGFDYVFVNGKETTVSLMIKVYDKNNKIISSIDPIEIPLKRSMLTIVRGEFLTSEANGGLGIDPNFIDEYDYEVN